MVNGEKKVVKKLKQNFNIDTSNIYSYNKLIDINMASIVWAREKIKYKYTHDIK